MAHKLKIKTKDIKINEYLDGDKILLRLVTLEDCNENYLRWLLNPKINQFLETRFHVQTKESIREFVNAMLHDQNNYLFAIIEKNTNKHIGNIKLGPIVPYHLYADVSYFIGEENAWGKGFATEAIKIVTKFAFERLKLHRLQAGLYASNKGSARALEKAGYTLEAIFKKQLCLHQQDDKYLWEDHIWYTIINEEKL